MAEIRPFRALHYNQEKIKDLSTVITQPYDKISQDMQSRYYAASSYNLVRVIKGKETPEDSPQDNVYTRACRDLSDWIKKEVLISDPNAAIYPYTQEYAIPGQPAVIKERRGFIALLKLEEYSAKVVHRHEETLSGPKADRMELLKKTQAHYGQVFFLYSDPDGKVEAALAAHTKAAPWEQLKDEHGTRHSVWRIAASEAEPVIQGMKDKKLVIADGHHRYETALAYRNLRRAEAGYDGRADYVMATFIRMETEGLTILPTHRVVHSLRGFDWAKFASEAKATFEWTELDATSALANSGKVLQDQLAAAGRKLPSVAAYAGNGKLALLSLRPEFNLAQALPDLSEKQRHLDVIILHRLLIERDLGISLEDVKQEKNLRYYRALPEAVGEVDAGKAQICFLMNPTPIEAVRDIAFAGQVMPQKSTDFYPKLLSGLTIYWLGNPLGI
ncbi:MAG TPA: DUF1015 domain-containing protein [Terriglobia bacterium]|nr:DUF1015 domain-containing protein [Terriglobia bacterium]